jgi:molybdate/tungstate transport system permease protein
MHSPNQTYSPFHLIVLMLSGLALLFVVAPLAGMLFEVSPVRLFQTAREAEVMGSLWVTLSSSFAATITAAFFALPLAYLLARRQFPFKGFVTGLIDLPIVIPHTAAGIALLGMVSRDTILGKAAAALGLSLVGSPLAIAIAMAFVSVPFLLNAARQGFEAVPLKLEQAALTLGASPARVFFTISIPLAWRGIVGGLVMMFARGMSEFGAVVILAYHPMTAPVLIFDRFNNFGLSYAVPVAVLFVGISLVFFITLRLLAKRRKDA